MNLLTRRANSVYEVLGLSFSTAMAQTRVDITLWPEGQLRGELLGGFHQSEHRDT
jgi:hypothetical protein